MRCVLAVDGGNSKTLALVATLDGTILSVERGACGDIYNATPTEAAPDPTAAALENVELTVATALRTASVTRDDIIVSVFNMAGADWPEDIAFWRDSMTERGIGEQVIAQNDALGVLYLGASDAVGVSIVCGTGAATGARSADGRIWHSSYWQDEWHGSTHLGQKTLLAIYRSELGLEPPTALTQRVLAHFGAASVEDVLHLFHNRRHEPSEDIGRLAPVLLDAADAGDEVALQVVREHGAGLGNIARVAMRKVGLENAAVPLVLAGGVFRHPTTVLEDAIVATLRQTAPAIRPMRSPAEPIIGVMLQALSTAGVVLAPSFLDRLLPNIPAVLLSQRAETTK
jgi:N-acetylglucosamine kinase-like BadF-type ATPase